MFQGDQCTTIFGMRGSGKSTLCRELQTYYPRVFVFDTLREYGPEQGTIVTGYAEFARFVIQTQHSKVFRCIIRFPLGTDSFDEFDECCKLLYYRGDCVVVLEEAQNFASIHRMGYWLDQICLTGRHKGVRFITTTQRIAKIHKTLISQASDVFAGYCDSALDLATLREYGFRTEMLQVLEPYQFIWKRGRESWRVDNSLKILPV